MNFHYFYRAINAIKHFRIEHFSFFVGHPESTHNGGQPHRVQFVGLEIMKIKTTKSFQSRVEGAKTATPADPLAANNEYLANCNNCHNL